MGHQKSSCFQSADELLHLERADICLGKRNPKVITIVGEKGL